MFLDLNSVEVKQFRTDLVRLVADLRERGATVEDACDQVAGALIRKSAREAWPRDKLTIWCFYFDQVVFNVFNGREF